MFEQDFSIKDLERLGPIVERLLQSGKLTDDEKWAVDQSCRAATDLAHIRHSDVAQTFYARSDIEERCESSIDEWLAQAFGPAEGNSGLRVLASGVGRPGVQGHDRATHHDKEATSEIPAVLVRRDGQSRRIEYARTSRKGEQCKRPREVG